MSAGVKKVLNRGGLIAVLVGIAAIVVGGGDAAAAIDTAGVVIGLVGGIMILVREVFN